ncbi:MAG: hypothetical protein HY270_12180 [Deltaproteobacteria bacterium]|nr:hypothetical protein [Deltaproteobacteria bacterium]
MRGLVFLVVMVAMLCGCAASRVYSCRSVINWDSTAPPKERALWLSYLMARVSYRGPAKECSAVQTIVPPTFDEEVDARTRAARTYTELKVRDNDLDVRYFNELALVAETGFMREYVWVYLRQPAWQEPSGLNLMGFQQWQRQNLQGHDPQTQGSISVVAE